ncbi:MAG TPA: MFS transporter [Candidatus Lustribacter sp.]|nr:MFS transporter [Candidatus Lustribacter sp.]
MGARSTSGRTIATVAIVSGTFLSVLSSTILYVPIADIARDLHVTIAAASLVITAQAITFATLLPLGDWTGSRFGRRKVYCIVIAMYGVAGIAGALAPNLPVLIAVRIFQGVSAAAIVPLVMSLLAELYGPAERPFALSAWAMANSLGQALGPPLGGILTAVYGWRSTFLPAAIIAVWACYAAWRYLPADVPSRQPLEWRGAGTLTVAALFLLTAFTLVPQLGPHSPLPLLIALAGCASAAGFVWAIRRTDQPFVSPQAFREPSYLMACIGVFGATVALSVALVAIPLYLRQSLSLPVAAAGFITLTMPLAMALTAPFSSVLVRRFGSRVSIQLGLIALAVATAALTFVVNAHLGVIALLPAMILIGAAVAAQYTAGATGATQTTAGRFGAGIGFFNLLRIAGAAAGPALVAMVLEGDVSAYATTFGISCAVVLAGLAATAIVNRPQVSAKPT